MYALVCLDDKHSKMSLLHWILIVLGRYKEKQASFPVIKTFVCVCFVDLCGSSSSDISFKQQLHGSERVAIITVNT